MSWLKFVYVLIESVSFSRNAKNEQISNCVFDQLLNRKNVMYHNLQGMDIQFNKQKNAKFLLDVLVSELFVCLVGFLRLSQQLWSCWDGHFASSKGCYFLPNLTTDIGSYSHGKKYVFSKFHGENSHCNEQKNISI